MVKHIRNMQGAVAVWLVSFLFFLLTLANNFSASHDSINYLLHITRGDHLFHQHHLLYHFLANKWLQGFSNIFTRIPDYRIIEAFTAVWGSLNLAMCYLFFRNRFNLGIPLSVAGIATIAFSFGTWFYSVNIEVYAPPVFFILCALYVITRKHFSQKDVALVAMLQSLAILFHQLNVLFTIIIVYWLITVTGKQFFKSAFKYLAVLTLICGGVYFYAGWIAESHSNLSDFTNWVLGYTKGHSYWQSLSYKTPLHVAVGFSRAFVGGHFVFQLPLLQHALELSFSDHGLRDELYLGKDIGTSVATILSIVSVVLLSAVVILVVRFVRNYRKMNLHFATIIPLLMTIIVYSLFFCFWMPEILEFWILQMMLTWLLIIGMLPLIRFPFKIPLLSGTVLITAGLFIVNYFGSIKWLRHLNHDYYYVEIKQLDPNLTKEDIVLVEGEWILKDYVRFYTPAKVIATDEPGYSKAQAAKDISIALISGHKVFTYKNENPPHQRWVSIQSY